MVLQAVHNISVQVLCGIVVDNAKCIVVKHYFYFNDHLENLAPSKSSFSSFIAHRSKAKGELILNM